MHSVDIYLDKARQNQALTSDAALSRALGVSVAQPSQWRTRRCWPSDHTMARLAELADMDVEQALLDLNQWRTADDKTRDLYARIAARLTGTAATVVGVTVAGCLLFAGQSEAHGIVKIIDNNCPAPVSAMYIMENKYFNLPGALIHPET